MGTNGGGIKMMELKTGIITRYEHNPADSNSIDDNYVNSIAIDKNEDLWIGTSLGLSRFDNQTGHFKKYLSKRKVYWIMLDSEGNKWAATSTGLFTCDKNADIFIPFVDQSGKLNSNWSIYGMVKDQQQALWLNTLKGILRLNKERNESVFYGKNQGFNPDISENLGYIRENGDVLFGDSLGYFTFDSKLLQQGTSRTTVNITGFLLNDIMVEPSSNGILTAPMEHTSEIRLTHDQNTFSFRFSFVDFISKHEDTRVKYMLQNYDNNWRLSDENREAILFQSPPR